MGMRFEGNKCKRALIKYNNDIKNAMMFILKYVDDPT